MKKLYCLFIISFVFNFSSYAQPGWNLIHSFNIGGGGIIFKDSLNGYAYPAYSGIYKTVDGGKTWNVQKIPGFNSSIIRIITLNNNTYIGIGSYGTTIKSTDGGNSWKVINIGSSDYLLSICHTPDNKLFVCSYENKIYSSTDSGENWSTYSLDTIAFEFTVPSQYTIQDIAFSDANTGYGVGNNKISIKTTNGGKTWFKISPIQESGMHRIKFLDNKIGYVLGGSDIAKTTDGGVTWIKKYTAGYAELRDITTFGKNIAWVVGMDKIIKTTNTGENWSLQSFSLSNNLNSVSCVDSLICFAGAGSLYKTTNGGISAPVLSNPGYGSIDLPLVLSLSWNSPPNGNPYRLQVATDYAFTKIVIDTTINQTSAKIKVPQMNTIYYWRVQEKFGNIFSPFSHIWNFKTINGTPVLSSPANNATEIDLTTTFSWIDVTLNPGSYHLELSTSSSFNTLFYNNSNVTSSSQIVSNLADSTTYYWRVRVKVSNSYSAWSGIWKFTTLAKTPKLLSPVNNSLSIPFLDIPLQWSKTTGTTEYRVQVSTDSLFHNNIIDKDKITGNSTTVNLSYDTKYYWRVGAKNVDGKTYWSGFLSFKTKLAPKTSFPLSVGNKWYYKAESTHRDYYYGAVKEITNILANGFREVSSKCFYKDRITNIKEYWAYIDGIFYSNTKPEVNTNNIVYDDYMSKDSCISYWYTSFCRRFVNYSVFNNSNTAQLYYHGSHSSAGHSGNEVTVFPEIGIVADWFSSSSNLVGHPSRTDSSYLIGMLKNGEVLGDTTFQVPADTATAFFPLEIGQKWIYSIGLEGDDQVTRTVTKILDNGFREITADYKFKDTSFIKMEYWLYQNNKLYISASPDLSVAEIYYDASLKGEECVSKNNQYYCIRWETEKYYFKDNPYDAQNFYVAYSQSSPHMSSITANNIGLVEFSFRSFDNSGEFVGWTEKLTNMEFDPTYVQENNSTTEIPKEYSLSNNFPNPFNPTTNIKYQIPKNGFVLLKVYDILGKEVATLVNEEKPAGYYNVEFSAGSLSSGIYFYRLQSGSFVETKKLILLK